MRRWVEFPAFAIIIGVMLFSMLSLSPKLAWSISIYSYSDMPSDKNTLFPDFPNTFQSNLTSYGISTFRPAGNDGVMNFYSPNTNDDIAPFGKDLYWDANTYTFSKPVFAVGFTFIATDYPNSDASGSFDNNVQNVSHEVRAYDKHGHLIENTFASSWTTRTGPRHFYIGGGIDFVASYAGIWTNRLIYSVSFDGIRPTDGVLMATYGSFSFSDTPLHGHHSVPEPSTLLLLSSGLLGLIGFRRKIRNST